MDLNKIFKSKIFILILGSIIGLIILLIIFGVGLTVGFRKAGFSNRWGENYHRNFAGPSGGFFRDFEGRDFINPHGTFGQIIKIDGSTLIIKEPNSVEKNVLVADKTVINSLNREIKISALKVDDQVVIIGEPNNAGQIEAKFIRLMPPSPPPPMPFKR